MSDLFDAAIIGGGPAGSAAATLLAQSGKRVLVLERDRFPRFHIGESLLPFSLATLDRLGVRDKIERAGFRPKHGAEVISGCGTREARFYFNPDNPRLRGTAYQVTRSEFDKLLLDHAAESGAEVLEETPVTSIESHTTHMEVATPSRNFSARYLIDASGRQSILAKKFDLRRPYPGLEKFAVFAHYENCSIPEGIDGTLTGMVREPDRWFWMIPLSPTRLSIGVVSDTPAFQQSGLKPEDYLEQRIRNQPSVAERLAGAERVTKVYASGDYSYRMRHLHGPRWLLAGDAAGFIDPIFSSGVFLAFLSAERAADAVAAALDRPHLARSRFAAYERDVRKVMNLYLRFVEGWYSKEFVETLLNPQDYFGLAKAVNAVLAGDVQGDIHMRWRLALFHLIVRLQRRLPLSPRLSFEREQQPTTA